MSAIWFTADDNLSIRNDGLAAQTFVMDIDNSPTTVQIPPKSERKLFLKDEFKVKAHELFDKLSLKAMEHPEWIHWFLHQLRFTSKEPQ